MATAVTPPDASAYAALSAGCALVERSELGKLGFVGPQAEAFLDGQVPNDVEGEGPGRGCYSALLTNKGKMLGELRLLRVEEETVLLLCERVALQAIFDVLRRALVGWRVELRKRTLQEACLSLIGPSARAVARAGDLPDAEHAHVASTLGGTPVRLGSPHPRPRGLV